MMVYSNGNLEGLLNGLESAKDIVTKLLEKAVSDFRSDAYIAGLEAAEHQISEEIRIITGSYS